MSDTALRNADVDTALNEAREAYIKRNPNSFAKYVEATAAMPGGNTRTSLFYSPFPVAMAKAEGCRLWDADGHEYVDFLGEYTAGIYGHSNPVIRKAIDAALDSGISMGAHNTLEGRFAKAICDRFGFERVRITNSGTEANLMSLVTARAVSGRRKFMVMHGGYHGAVFTFAGGGSPINAPFEFVLGTYNDIDATKKVIAENEKDIAAIILEPMMGSTGCIPAERDFLQMLRDEATRIGAWLIFDEVMTSRLSPGGLQAKHGIKPDLTSLGKYVGGGMSFGAFGGRADILDRYDPRRPDALPHAGTFNNNVLTMAAGYAGLTEVYTPQAADGLNARGDKLRETLNELCKAAGAKMQFTGIGSMMSVHFTRAHVRSPKEAGEADQKLKELFFFDMLEKGIWIARRGFFTLCLPLGEKEYDKLVQAVQEFLESRRSLLAVD